MSCIDTLFPSYLVSPHSLAFLDTSRPRRCVSFCTYTNRYVGLSARGSKSRSLHSPCLCLSRTPSHSELFTLNLAANRAASSSSQDVCAPLDTSEETVARKIKDQDENTEHDNDSQTISTGLESSSGDVAESDSADDLHKNHSAGLQIVCDRQQRRLAERDGMLELIGKEQVSDKDCAAERDTGKGRETGKEICQGTATRREEGKTDGEGKEGGRQGGGKGGLVKSGSEASLTSDNGGGDVKTSMLLHRQVNCAFKVGSNSKTKNNQVEGHAGMGDEKKREDQESEYDLVDDIGRSANNADRRRRLHLGETLLRTYSPPVLTSDQLLRLQEGQCALDK